jgi:hypothetical protein
MLSSVAPREMRKKSGGYRLIVYGGELWASIPLKATVLKQNCGVREGGGRGCVIMSFGAALGASVREDFFQRKSASVVTCRDFGMCSWSWGLGWLAFDCTEKR